MLSLKYTSDSIKGTERKENKDRVLIRETDDYLLAVLFDGISSATEANKGIDIAVNFIEENYSRFSDANDHYDLAGLMFEAHLAITRAGLSDPFTTFCAVCISDKKEWSMFSGLGDSRVYEVTPQYIKQLSHDDNLLHNKNVVTRYLGMVQLKREDFVSQSFDVNGKRILLCSDGFYSFLENDIKIFHTTLNQSQLSSIKNGLSSIVSGKNLDDSSYILIL